MMNAETPTTHANGTVIKIAGAGGGGGGKAVAHTWCFAGMGESLRVTVVATGLADPASSTANG